MAQYFFHLRDGTDHILDPEGTELADLPAVQQHTMRCARDTLSNADFPVLQQAKRAFDRAHGNPVPNSTETGKTDNPPDPESRLSVS